MKKGINRPKMAQNCLNLKSKSINQTSYLLQKSVNLKTKDQMLNSKF